MGDWTNPDGAGGFAVTITPLDPVLSIGAALYGAGMPIPASATWPVANKAIFVPFLVPETMTVVKMFAYNGATAAGNQDVGIYDAAGHRLVSIGSTAQAGINALQVHDITDTVLRPGRYYMAMGNSGTTGTYFSAGTLLAAVCGGLGMLEMASAVALPDPATFAAASSAYVPVFGLTGRVLT